MQHTAHGFDQQKTYAYNTQPASKKKYIQANTLTHMLLLLLLFHINNLKKKMMAIIYGSDRWW